MKPPRHLLSLIHLPLSVLVLPFVHLSSTFLYCVQPLSVSARYGVIGAEVFKKLDADETAHEECSKRNKHTRETHVYISVVVLISLGYSYGHGLCSAENNSNTLHRVRQELLTLDVSLTKLIGITDI